MFGSIAMVLLVVILIWLVWKLGLFNPVVNLADAATMASEDFTDKVTNKSVKNAVKYEISDDAFNKAMKAKAKNRRFREQMRNQNTTWSEDNE